MLTARTDVSNVPPQGAYVAKQCPVRSQYDVIRPGEPLPVSAALQRRFDRGIEFEANIFAELAAVAANAVVIERGGPDDRADREARTMQAMADGAAVIIGGRLPADLDARRVGEPDLLVAASGGGYHPVDVKHHATLTAMPASGAHIDALCATLDAPSFDAAAVDPERAAKKRKGDLLQLAHYRRLLEACGHAATSNHGGIVGTERSVTWYDLDVTVWSTPSTSERKKMRSIMEVYDFEFGFRLDIIATAQRHLDDDTVPLLVVPVRIGECSSCPWWGHCRGQLEESADVSLLPRVGWNLWKTYHDAGIASLDDLASLDWRTADLADRRVDLANLFAGLETSRPDTSIAEVIGIRKTAQTQSLIDAGVHTAADASGLDRGIAALPPATRGSLAENIDLARAMLSEAPVFRRRGIDELVVPRGDIEIDIDMENVEDGVYLWGALVTDRSGTGSVEEGYIAFATWEPLTPELEYDIFDQLWRWLTNIRDRARHDGHTIRVYCYNETAEMTEMRRLATCYIARLDMAAEVEELVGSPDWVDLLRVARAGLITGTGMGLKNLAPLSGFHWDDDDPGGEQPMQWHDLAVASPDPEDRDENQRRLLTYNRNDVEATLALRIWMNDHGSTLPSISELDEGGHAHE